MDFEENAALICDLCGYEITDEEYSDLTVYEDWDEDGTFTFVKCPSCSHILVDE